MDVDARIEQLSDQVERVGENLRDLDDYTARRLLGSSRLSGITARVWQEAEVDLAALWQEYVALVDHVAALTRLRGHRPRPARHAQIQLESMLDGSTVIVAGPPLDPMARSLVGAVAPSTAHHSDDLLRQMSATFDRIGGLVSRVDEVWSETIPRGAAELQALTDVAAAAAAAQVRVPNTAKRVRDQLETLVQLGRDDPLALDLTVAEKTITDAGAERNALIAAIQVRHNADDLAHTVRVAIAEAGRAIEAAHTTIHAVAPKIDSSIDSVELGPLIRELKVLIMDLDQIMDRASSDWGSTGRRLAELEKRALGISSAASHTAATVLKLLDTRDELRGRLTAFQAKAIGLGLAENIGLDQRFQAAVDELYSAPCSLERAEALVSAYRDQLERANREVT